GLYLQVNPNGSKYWRFKYRYADKEKKLAFGVYPDVSLADARDKRDAARKLVANDVDPGLNKQIAKRTAKLAVENSFQAIAVEWYAKFSKKWVPSHGERIFRRLEKDVFPWLGKRPIHEIKAPELLALLRRIESRGAIESAHRTNQNCGQVFRYAIATGRAERDISSDLRGALAPVITKHHASIVDPTAIGELLRTINDYRGYFVTKCALQLAPLVFVRPGELRHAEWSEFNFETNEWRIPAEKMKMRETHIVPLSNQAIEILQEVYAITGDSKYVFPSIRSHARPMSENTVTAALRRLGYTKDEMTGHGFRSMASTLLNEQGWNRDVIERQLAHAERNSIRAAYNYAEYLPERRKMMQHWADYLQALSGCKEKVSLQPA
ncbi:MAG: tyrosine-type recombinase/integrase, partial [Gammaproteobacteria bacterium]